MLNLVSRAECVAGSPMFASLAEQRPPRRFAPPLLKMRRGKPRLPLDQRKIPPMNAPSDIKSYMLEVGRRARAASREVARADTASKNRALLAAAKAIRRDARKLLAANAEDVKTARAAGKDAAFIDRLTLTEKTIEGMAEGLEQVVETADRAAVGQLLSMNEYVDIIVPRGGKDLIERVMRESRIPMIKHLDGVCHVYIDERANLEKAIRIADNAKTQRYGVCNAMETLLVAEKIAPRVLPRLAKIYADKGVELRGDEKSRALVSGMKPATEEDWYAEYLAPILAVRVVRDLSAAIEHIGKYGSQHTDAIVTEDEASARRFLREVDSSSVLVNASTRFADGFEYGLGAEIGISTDKLHARGPVGLEGLTSQKYVVFGSGQIRQ